MRVYTLVLLFLLLASSAAWAADDEGEVLEIKKDSFTIRTKKGDFSFFVSVKLAKGKVDPEEWTHPHSFKDLRVGQYIEVESETTVERKWLATRLKVVKQPKDLAFQGNEGGEVLQAWKDRFFIKTKDGRVFVFGVSDKLAKGDISPDEKVYRDGFKDLKKGQQVEVNYKTVDRQFVAQKLWIREQPPPKNPKKKR